jgi:hypothetical protein
MPYTLVEATLGVTEEEVFPATVMVIEGLASLVPATALVQVIAGLKSACPAAKVPSVRVTFHTNLLFAAEASA